MAALDVEAELMTPCAEDTSDVEISKAQPRQGTRVVLAVLAIPLAAFVLASVAYAGFAATRVQQKTGIPLNKGGALISLEEYADCGQEAACKGASNPSGYNFCPTIINGGQIKNCPCDDCCTIYPDLPLCTNPNNGDSSDSSDSTSTGGACFPGDAEVQILGKESPIAIGSLNIGDFVVAESEPGRAVVYDQVVGFIHRDPDAKGEYLNVQHESGHLLISPKHLLFVDGHVSRIQKFAEGLVPGDQLATALGTTSRVLSVRRERDGRGWYAPLTTSGTIVVDGVLASNYANVRAHHAAHAAFFPVRAYKMAATTLAATLGVAPSTTPAVLHPFAAALWSLEALMPQALK